MRKRLIKYSIFTFIILLIFLPGYTKYHRLLEQKEANQKRLEELKKENERLAEESRRLKEDPLYLESLARENLGLAKEGEIVVKFKSEQPRQKD